MERNFIQITNEDGNKVVINTNHIIRIEEGANGTDILIQIPFSTDHQLMTLTTEESFRHIKSALGVIEIGDPDIRYL